MQCECKICGNLFEKSSNSQKYCSESCKIEAKKLQDSTNSHKTYIRNKSSKPPITATCEYCGKEFIKTHGNQKYCSKQCADDKIRELNADARMRWYHRNKKRGGDKIYGLGSGGLGPHKQKDDQIEHEKIHNELRRLKLIPSH